MNDRLRHSRLLGNSRLLAAACVCAAVFAAPNAFAQDADSPSSSDAAAVHQAAAEADEPVGVSASIGPWMVTRSMVLRANGQTIEHQPNVYLGGMLRVGADLVDFDAIDATLRFEGEGGFAVARNVKIASGLSRAPVTKASFISARLALRRPVGEHLNLDIGLGAMADSFIVEPNRTYTGHRYIGADFRVGLQWASQSSDWVFEGDLSALPVFVLDQSGGATGEGSAFGARLGAQVGYDILSALSDDGYMGGRLTLRYDYTRYRSQFPEQRVMLDGGVSQDNSHALTLMFGLYL